MLKMKEGTVYWVLCGSDESFNSTPETNIVLVCELAGIYIKTWISSLPPPPQNKTKKLKSKKKVYSSGQYLTHAVSRDLEFTKQPLM